MIAATLESTRAASLCSSVAANNSFRRRCEAVSAYLLDLPMITSLFHRV